MDDRRLSVIVVPHGDLETRTLEIPYRTLKVLVVVAFAVFVSLGLMVGFWFNIAAKAA